MKYIGANNFQKKFLKIIKIMSNRSKNNCDFDKKYGAALAWSQRLQNKHEDGEGWDWTMIFIIAAILLCAICYVFWVSSDNKNPQPIENVTTTQQLNSAP